jgi:hypothetical protein
MVSLRVLGPLEAEMDGLPVDLGGRLQRPFLARQSTTWRTTWRQPPR